MCSWPRPRRTAPRGAAAQPSKKAKIDATSSVDPARLVKQCMGVMGELMAIDISEPFNVKVDWKGLGLNDYPKVVKHPMDLGTVKARAASDGSPAAGMRRADRRREACVRSLARARVCRLHAR